MREENIQRNSRKRLNALILLVAFTAILFIVATYAWFSNQRDVSLTGITGQVNVAEGLQISLDAKHWSNTINFTDLLGGTATNYLDAGKTLALPYGEGTGEDDPSINYIPTELLPCSTTGIDGDGIGAQRLMMYTGTNTEGIQLAGIHEIDDDAYYAGLQPAGTAPTTTGKGYYAIDFFLQNSSAKSDDGYVDLLQLEPGSDVALNVAGKESTGLQNTLRVAFAKYNADDGTYVKVNDEVTDQAAILASFDGNPTISDVAIWEPNASGEADLDADPSPVYAAHVDYIVLNNNKLTLDAGDQFGTEPKTNQFTASDYVPTFALTAASATKKSLTDIYNWTNTDITGNSTGLVRQTTLQTPNTGITGANALQLISADPGADYEQFRIPAGTFVKMRMYIWLEGQDVDCINYASTGGQVNIDVGISKPATGAVQETTLGGGA